jgi:serine/threonine-protein kinase
MGSLYLGHDPKLKRPVAIKLLNEDVRDDPELRNRFAREAESVARLRHPNIVVVFDVGEDDNGDPFMAMEFIAGETLKRILEPPSIPVLRRLSLVEDLCAGLAHAHAAGIVHRDIKPANVMLDPEGVLKILDFGIARQLTSATTQDRTMAKTQAGAILGTVNYMSPEQIVGGVVDHRSDIFAVGAVLYEAIALQMAFPGAFPEVYHRVVTAGPVPVSQLVPGVDPDLARVVDRALERDPERRYQQVSLLRQDIAVIRERLSQSLEGAATGAENESARRRDEAATVQGTIVIARPTFARLPVSFLQGVRRCPRP